MPMPTASDELNTSTSSMGWWASNCSLTGSLHMAPEEIVITSEPRSHLPGFSSSTASSGREKGSPTMTSPLTFSRSIVSSISTGSYRRDSRRQTRPPSASVVLAVKEPVPCMRGQAGINVAPTPGVVSRLVRTPSIPPWTS